MRALIVSVAAAITSPAIANETMNTQIRIQIEGTQLIGTLEDNATTRDFLALLPLAVTLDDYASTEKVTDLPKKLSTDGAPQGVDPDVGDITYYAPWGNLALFYKDFGYSKGLIKLGRLDAGADVLRRPGKVQARIERIEASSSVASPSSWPADELERIATNDDLHVSPYREDGKTYGTPTWIWSVAVEGNLYVRAYNGVRSRWYQAAIRERAGRIIAAGITRQVVFEPVQGTINAKIDTAYRVKYAGSPYLDSMIGERARAATVKILPAPSEKRR